MTILTLCNGPHSVCGVYFSLNLSKSISYLSLCLSLNSFCDETSRTWASLCPETRYHGFWLGLSCSHVGLSPKQGFGWVWVQATWVQVSNWILAGFIKSQDIWVQVPICGKRFHSYHRTSNSAPGYISRRRKINTNSKKYKHPNVHSKHYLQ